MHVYVEVSRHALARAAARFPDMPAPRETITRDVLAAVAGCRMATKLPRWALMPGQRRGRGDPWIRFLWDEARTRVYVVDRRQRHLVVITVIKAGEADTSPA